MLESKSQDRKSIIRTEVAIQISRWNEGPKTGSIPDEK